MFCEFLKLPTIFMKIIRSRFQTFRKKCQGLVHLRANFKPLIKLLRKNKRFDLFCEIK